MAKKPYVIALEEHYQDPEVNSSARVLAPVERSLRGSMI
jgi:hypothetical protein